VNSRKVYGYVRVSTRGQAQEGVSLEAQAASIKAFASLKATTLRADGKDDDALAWDGIEVVADAGKSARTMRRPGLERIRKAIGEGKVMALVVFKVDRASRSTLDLLNLLRECEERRASFVSVCESIDTSTSMGRFLVTLLASLAALESGTIGERTVMALRHKRQQGLAYSGAPPFGWKREGDRLVPVSREQNALADAKRMRAEGKSFRDIVKFFEARNVRPHGGKKWFAASVRQILNTKMAQEVA